MSWAVGYDPNWKRDIGYGVPAICDHPGCGEAIDRGLGYVCGGEPYGGEYGCGLYFCEKHLHHGEHAEGFRICERCLNGDPPFKPTPDRKAWTNHKLTHWSWERWRRENDIPDPLAVVSECGRYRYALTRILREGPPAPPLIWIMLNPSTADAVENDPTIRRCMEFGRLWGFGRMTVVNLFAYRATSPLQLQTAADAVGPENDAYLASAVTDAGMVVCAWGRHGSLNHRARKVCANILAGQELRALRVNKDGSPMHPLYVPYTQSPEPWRFR